jgi:hypothetical protein
MDWIVQVARLIAHFLALVPNTVWAALIAAGVAFLTTTLSNRNSRKQLQMQLGHSARERERDRAMALRRDVYLPAIEAVTRAHGALGLLVDLDADLSALGKQMTADFATLAKVQLIAGETTVRGLLGFQKALMPAYFELLAHRSSLAIRRGAIATEQALIDRALAEHRRFVQMMQQINLSAIPDGPAMERVKAQPEIQMNEMKVHVAKQAELHREQTAEHLSVTARLSDLSLEIARFMPDTLISARQELDLPIDPDEYKRLFAEQQDGVQRAIRDFIDRFRNAGRPPS